MPTLFQRPDYLMQALESISEAGEAYVILMGPQARVKSTSYPGLIDEALEEPNLETLSAKINYGMAHFPESVDLLTWLGDDDMLEPESLSSLEEEFRNDLELSLIFGSCLYVDRNGKYLGENKSGKWAIPLAKVGPFLAPQPGSLFRRKSFEDVGGLDIGLSLAFDFDLFMALSKQGKVQYSSKTLARFRWHRGSLSVSQRMASSKEASIVRNKHASTLLRKFLLVTNPVVQLATLVAGSLVNRRLMTRKII